MGLEVYLYVLFTMMFIFILNGVNINAIMKQNKEIEAKLLVLTLSFILSYLLTSFVMAFLGWGS